MRKLLPYLLMGVAVGATTLVVAYAAKISADDALRFAVDDIETDCDDQLSLLLHINASEMAEKISSTNRISREEIDRLAAYLCVDEFNLVGPDGRIVITSDPSLTAGDMFFLDEHKQGEYRALLDGRRATVRQRFRVSATQHDRLMKYFALAMSGGRFIQIGYLWESFEQAFPRFFLPIFEERIIGKAGFCLVLNDKGLIEMSVPGHPEAKGMKATAAGLRPEHLTVPPDQIFFTRLFGTLCRCLYYRDDIAKRRILAAVPVGENIYQTVGLALGVALVLIAAFIGFRMVLQGFRRAQAKIDALRAAEEQRRAADMSLARSIQLAELRTDGTEGDGYRLATLMNAAREVGGDFYDYYELPDGRLVVTIADVSGKGVPAAFFMIKARATLKSCVYSSSDLVKAVSEANVRLARNNPAEMFVTAWVGIYDRKAGTLDYVSAGHNPPLVKRANGKVEWLDAPRSAALGVFESAKYRGAHATLAANDRLFLYTDGVTEAMNAAGELFGNERLEATLSCGAAGDGTPTLPSSGLVPVVKNAVDAFVAGAEQSDDITMLELCVKI